MKKTKVVCTIGPASESLEKMLEFIQRGMDVARLNFSHGSHEEHQIRINTLKEAREMKQSQTAILLDTKGPEIRTGKFDQAEIELMEGQGFTITMDEIVGNRERCTVSYKDLAKDVKSGDTILIDDGLIELKVIEVAGNDIQTKVVNSGIIKNNKGVNVPNVKINLPAITPKDKDDIIFGIKNDIDFIAASFVRKALDVMAIREILEKENATHIQIISKIENQEGVDNIDEILQVSDGIMVARGDLGVEIPTEEIPVVQKMIIKKCNLIGKPVITATQMLDSMIRNPRPTRAEVTDVANAIYDGSDAIMLSGETAAGKYPIEAIETMARIAKRIETTLDYENMLFARQNSRETTITNAISHATCTVARDVHAQAIITATTSGYTARAVSSYRPESPIIASVSKEHVGRQLSLVWGVTSIIVEEVASTDEMFEQAVARSIGNNLVEAGDTVVITAGVPVGKAGTTNLIKVHLVSEAIVIGTGIGNYNVTGIAKIIRSERDQIKEGEIFVGKFTDVDHVDRMRKASAIIVEEGGLTNHAAVVGVSLGIPVIVGAKDITKLISSGEEVTIDIQSGRIYRGKIDIV